MSRAEGSVDLQLSVDDVRALLEASRHEQESR